MAKGCGNNSTEFWYYGKGNITGVTVPSTTVGRGNYPSGDYVHASLTNTGIGKGAILKASVEPHSSLANRSQLSGVQVISGGLNYGTHRYTSSQIVVAQRNPDVVLGSSTTSSILHGSGLTVAVNSGFTWHQAQTLEGQNALISSEVDYRFNAPSNATITLINQSLNMSNLFFDGDVTGQFVDFFREGQEILLRDHTTHIILFRGIIQELEDTYELGFGSVIRIIAADHMREWEDIPAEGLRPSYTGRNLKRTSSKIYSIIENKVGTYQNKKGSVRQIAFGEGPLYRLNSSPTNGSATDAIFPQTFTGSAEQEDAETAGTIAPEVGHGHQVGRRFAFESSWYPRESKHFDQAGVALTEGAADNSKNEALSVQRTYFNKGKQKVLGILNSLATQDPHGQYLTTSNPFVYTGGSETEWAFHLAPNILTPTPEILLGTGASATNPDGKNGEWLTSNTRSGTAIGGSGAGILKIATGNALYGQGFTFEDVGKLVTGTVSSGTIPTLVLGVSSDGTELYTNESVVWTAAAFTIAESLTSIPQFNYFEVGSRPAFAFDTTAEIGTPKQTIGEITDAGTYSVTMISPTQPVAEQGISKDRATTSDQSAALVSQPHLTGTANGTVETQINGTYGIKNVLTWEVRMASEITFQYRQGTLGTEMESVAWSSASGTIVADQWYDLLYNIQFRLGTAGSHTTGDIYRFTSYPQFDNTRALRLMSPEATWAKYNHEKYSNALIWYNGEVEGEGNEGGSGVLRCELIYGWNVQNRSWMFSTSLNDLDDKTYNVKVHTGDALTPNDTAPFAGGEDACVNFTGNTTPVTDIDEFKRGDKSIFLVKTRRSGIPGVGEDSAQWDAVANLGAYDVSIYPYRDFLWRNKQLKTGKISIFSGDMFGADRGGRASEYLDVYRGRYSEVPLNDAGAAAGSVYQVEWRRWGKDKDAVGSGHEVAAVQYVSHEAQWDATQTSSSHINTQSGGGDAAFPFAAGKDEQKMSQILISFDKDTMEENWPITNTYNPDGRPQIGNWEDFPYVRLVGRTTGTKIDFDASVSTRPDGHPWEGRPMDSWGTVKPLRKVYRKEAHMDAIRVDIASALHKRVSDMRIGKFKLSKAPYYWLEAQVDGFTKTGGEQYGNDVIDPSTATTNPNQVATIRFKLQKIGATTGTTYYNPLQYGLMIGNIVRFYTHSIGDGGSDIDQDFRDSQEFCYGVITDIEPITTAPSNSNEDTFDMCGWIEVQLPLTQIGNTATTCVRKTGATETGIKYQKVTAAATTGESGYTEDLANPGVALSPVEDYAGPTRVRVYNMLYPGYAIRVEDMLNGISAKHLIEGMHFTNSRGSLQTEMSTSGKKADQRISKWGSTPIHLQRLPFISMIEEGVGDSASGITATEEDEVQNNDWYMGSMEWDAESEFAEWQAADDFES